MEELCQEILNGRYVPFFWDATYILSTQETFGDISDNAHLLP